MRRELRTLPGTGYGCDTLSGLYLADPFLSPAFALKSPTIPGEAAETAWSVLKMLRNLIPASKIRISLHAGPVFADEDTSCVSGAQTEVVKTIQQFVIAGKIYASFQFACVLAIGSKDYAMEYAGLISIRENEKIEIYQLNRHAEAFDL